MIVREREDEYVLITQHDHGVLSGDIAKQLKREFFLHHRIDDVVFAAYEHDRCWTKLDRTCRVDPDSNMPYTFMNYPIAEKLTVYRQGLDDIEKKNEYAALLCSMHFCVLLRLDPNPQEIIPFIRQEEIRQNDILARLPREEHFHIERHLAILQFCDRLSLYVCLNEPGVLKEDEHPWYRNGIDFLGGMIGIQWANRREIVLGSFPFEAEFETSIRYTTVSKGIMGKEGTSLDLTDAKWMKQAVFFRPLDESSSGAVIT